MSAIPTKPETPDELDKLFSDFFKAQLKRPWPNAPLPAGAAAPASEPSGLVNTRTQTETPRNSPAPAPQAYAKGRDGAARARFTLAASVALALGGCWVLSNGFLPGSMTQGTPTTPGILQHGGSDGKDHDTLKTMEKNRALENNGGVIDPGNDNGGFLDKSGDDPK
jgi:hypothetical protein